MHPRSNTPSFKSGRRHPCSTVCQTTPSSTQERVPAATTPCRRRHMLVSPLLSRYMRVLTQLHNEDCGWVFAQHFCNRLGQAYLALKGILDETNPAHASVLDDIKRRFREETFTRESIAQVIHGHADLVSILTLSMMRAADGDAMVDQPALCQLCDDALPRDGRGCPAHVLIVAVLS